MKILLVEDDAKLGRFLGRVMTDEGYEAELVTRGELGLERARRPDAEYALIVLDRMLPDGDGLETCRALRRAGVMTPVLMLTARGDLGERVEGLDGGADDYLVKPFEVDELVARIRALTRRASARAIVRVGSLEIDRLERRATLDGIGLELTAREFELLQCLAQASGEPVSRQVLLSQIWQLEFDPNTNIVEVHVSRLRDKMGGYAWMIETVRGSGYRMRPTRH